MKTILILKGNQKIDVDKIKLMLGMLREQYSYKITNTNIGKVKMFYN